MAYRTNLSVQLVGQELVLDTTASLSAVLSAVSNVNPDAAGSRFTVLNLVAGTPRVLPLPESAGYLAIQIVPADNVIDANKTAFLNLRFTGAAADSAIALRSNELMILPLSGVGAAVTAPNAGNITVTNAASGQPFTIAGALIRYYTF